LCTFNAPYFHYVIQTRNVSIPKRRTFQPLFHFVHTIAQFSRIFSPTQDSNSTSVIRRVRNHIRSSLTQDSNSTSVIRRVRNHIRSSPTQDSNSTSVIRRVRNHIRSSLTQDSNSTSVIRRVRNHIRSSLTQDSNSTSVIRRVPYSYSLMLTVTYMFRPYLYNYPQGKKLLKFKNRPPARFVYI
jgi:hypothetical protein